MHPGTPYRIRQLKFNALPPLSASDVEKASGLKSGDLAGTLTLRHASDSIEHAYGQQGFLDAKARVDYPRDPATHTADCTFTVVPGAVFHLARIDTSYLPSGMQADFAKDSKLAAGIVADEAVLKEINRLLNDWHVANKVSISIQADRKQHLAVYALKTAGSKP